MLPKIEQEYFNICNHLENITEVIRNFKLWILLVNVIGSYVELKYIVHFGFVLVSQTIFNFDQVFRKIY